GRIIDHGTRRHPDAVVTEVSPSGLVEKLPFSALGTRCAGLAAALEVIGVGPGDVVATLLDNRTELLELLLAVPAMGAVVHPVNIALQESLLLATLGLVDETVLVTGSRAVDFLAANHHRFPSVRHVVLVDAEIEDVDPESWPGVSFHSYEQILDGRPAEREWPELDEDTAAMVVSTSGTTGAPKSVVYSHRAIYLHAIGMGNVDAFGLCSRDTVATLVPFFHVAGWGLPYASLMFGSGLVLTRASESERPSLGAALGRALAAAPVTAITSAPAHVADYFAESDVRRQDFEGIDRVVFGGSGASPSLVHRLRDELGIAVLHGWGMTETGPIGAVSLRDEPVRDVQARDEGSPADPGATADTRPAPDGTGRDHSTAPGVQPGAELAHSTEVECRFSSLVSARIVDFHGVRMRDSVGVGELEVRGPHVTARYLDSRSAEGDFEDGWLRTGDLARLSHDGALTLVDRASDAIRSGGEWISSVELENAVMQLPGVGEAACVGVPDDQWGQRPLCVVASAPGASHPSPRELWEGLYWIPEWSRPDHWAFIEYIPRTSVGKFDKRALRRWFAQGRFDVETFSR
uniref:AMP-binding protein n=1 Tax=Dietzia sp. TaxID=1871616 RepID=UPI002FD8E5BF